VAASQGTIIAFLDDDAVAFPGWLDALCHGFHEESVVGVGGRSHPLWPGPAPVWFPEEFYWVVGASYKGMPLQAGPVRNVWSENMAVRREAFDAVGGFRAGFGKTGQRSRPEDTDLCLRIATANPGQMWRYEPGAEIGHKVPEKRTTVRFYLSRCWHEGRGKAELAALLGSGHSMSAERSHAVKAIPRGALEGIRASLHGRDASGLKRTGAISAGFAAAAAGMLVGTVATRTNRSGRRSDVAVDEESETEALCAS
jgi:hypothetical protein